MAGCWCSWRLFCAAHRVKGKGCKATRLGSPLACHNLTFLLPAHKLQRVAVATDVPFFWFSLNTVIVFLEFHRKEIKLLCILKLTFYLGTTALTQTVKGTLERLFSLVIICVTYTTVEYIV